MKYLAFAVLTALIALPGWSQSGPEDTIASRDAIERERIQQTRATEQARITAREIQCYARFAVNDCLADVRKRRREVLGDLRRQEISINDAQRKRRAAEQLLRSDEKASRSP